MENKDKKVDFNNLEKEDNGQEERNVSEILLMMK